MNIEDQIKNAAKVALYTPAERAAYEHGIQWGMARVAASIRLTGAAASTAPSGAGPAVKAVCDGLADTIEKAAGYPLKVGRTEGVE